MTRRARYRWGAAVVAVLALLGCLLLGLHAPRPMLLSYLAAYLFFLAPVLGSVVLLLVHALTGGGWGEDLRLPLLAASGLLPLLTVLAVPFIALAGVLYPWADPQHAPAALADPHLAHQLWYLNLPFFIGRAVVIFALWLWLAHAVRRHLALPPVGGAMAGLAAAGLIVYLLTITLAAADWVMSLLPIWHSTVFGVLIGTSQLVVAAAVAVLFGGAATAQAAGPRRASDVGMLLMALVLAWAYLGFMDYLTAWIADQPAETHWYLPRLHHGWGLLAAALLVVHLLLPFAILLSRRAKQHAGWLCVVAGLLLLGQAGYMLWLVRPNALAPGAPLGWSDALAWLGIGALCWAGYDWQLAGRREARP